MKRKHTCVAVLLGSVWLGWVGVTRAQGEAVEGPESTESPGPEMVVVTYDHSLWDDIVGRYVTTEGCFDYAALLEEPTDLERLDAYLEGLSLASLARLSESEVLAFWINAHNACAVRAVLDRYPIASARNISRFFDGPHCSAAGQTYSLNDLVNDQIRQISDDPRLYFALNTASRGAPPLRNEAYTGPLLESQLADQGHHFVRRTTQVHANTMEVELNKLFEWFGHDFDRYGGVRDFVAAQLDPHDAELVRQPAIMLIFTEYDWRLNEPVGERSTPGEP